MGDWEQDEKPQEEPGKPEEAIGEEPGVMEERPAEHQPSGEVAEEPLLSRGEEGPQESAGPSVEEEAAWEAPPATVTGGPSQDERSAAAIAHGSVVLNLVSGFGGVVVALVIWLTYKDKSEYVRYQSLQALVFQALVLVGTAAIGILATIVIVLGGIAVVFLVGIPILILGIIAVLVTVLIPIIGAVYGVVAAVEAYNGRDFRYWVVADLVQ